MEFIVAGIVMIVVALVWEKHKPAVTYLPPARVRHSLVDYSFGRAEVYGALARTSPEGYEAAALALLGPAVYDVNMSRALAAAQAVAVAPPITAPAAPTPTFPVYDAVVPKPVFFKEGEPRTLEEYEGQRHVVDYLQAVSDGLPHTKLVPQEHQLFLGPPGLGKTLLAKCFANTLLQRNEALGLPPIWFQEEFPADLPDLKALDRAVSRASMQPTIIFIDEIHDLKTEGHALKLYLLMEEGRYKFEGSDFPVEVPNVLINGATTDYGAVHPALQRRFNRHALMPLSKDQITDIVMKVRGLPITPEGTVALVDRTYFSGAPWEALQLYRQALQFALQRKAKQVQVVDVERVFESQQIDALGLRWMDRAVLRVLLDKPKYRNGRGGVKEFVCYAASENDTCAMAQVDGGEYRESIKPRLMARGLLEVRATYGQALTQKAVSSYGWLVPKTA